MSLEAARRQMQAAAHRLADQTGQRIDAGPDPFVIATVTTVVAGGASDGNNLVKVTFRNGETVAAGWNASQTFAVGQRVLCALVQNQLIPICPIVGQP